MRIASTSCVFAVAILTACSSSSSNVTETIVVVRADPTVQTAALQLHIEVQSDRDAPQHFDHDFEFPLWPERLKLTPAKGDATRHFTLRAVATDSDGAQIASLKLTSGFVAKQTRFVALELSPCAFDGAIEIDTAVLAPSEEALTSETTAVCEDLQPNVQPAAGSGGEQPEAGHDAAEPEAGAGGASEPAEQGPRCGDGELDPGEKCDPGIASGAGKCPSECNTGDACAVGKLIGSGCQAYCEVTPVSQARNDDGCCPSAANANDDDDCQPRCGNGVIESGETCDPPGSCSAEARCGKLDKCMLAAISGEPGQCTAVCAPKPVSACVSGDGCCPSGCKRDQDQDCSPSCGDGVVDPALNETCEPNSAAQPCPSSCDDHDSCTKDMLIGSAEQCSAACMYTPIASNAQAKDGCCPRGADAVTDKDCVQVCGNGVVEQGEDCDDHNTTSGDGCSATCKLDDNLATPGDDRAHYFTCFEAGTCGPNTLCCLPPPIDGGLNSEKCVEEAQCARFTHDCDGPEDCPAGQQCWSTGCHAMPTSKDYRVACHSQVDCAGASCLGGMMFPCPVCSPQGTCEAN